MPRNLNPDVSETVRLEMFVLKQVNRAKAELKQEFEARIAQLKSGSNDSQEGSHV